MRFILSALLGLSWLASAATIPFTDKPMNETLVARDISGYRSVAYFVNWVSHVGTDETLRH